METEADSANTLALTECQISDPTPLQPKSDIWSERVFNGLNIPFVHLGNFPGFDDLYEQGHPNAQTTVYHAITRGGRLQSLRDIFDGENVVYRRTELTPLNLNSGMYNASLVTLN